MAAQAKAKVAPYYEQAAAKVSPYYEQAMTASKPAREAAVVFYQKAKVRLDFLGEGAEYIVYHTA